MGNVGRSLRSGKPHRPDRIAVAVRRDLKISELDDVVPSGFADEAEHVVIAHGNSHPTGDKEAACWWEDCGFWNRVEVLAVCRSVLGILLLVSGWCILSLSVWGGIWLLLRPVVVGGAGAVIRTRSDLTNFSCWNASVRGRGGGYCAGGENGAGREQWNGK